MKRIIAIAALLAAGVVAACSQGGAASPSFSLPSVAPIGSPSVGGSSAMPIVGSSAMPVSSASVGGSSAMPGASTAP